MTPNKHKISEEDIDFWHNITQDINKTAQPEVIPAPLPVFPEIRNSINPTCVYQGNTLTDLNIGNTDNIDRCTAERFRRGDFKIEARLDLHGYTEDKAYDKVENFVKNAYIQGLRCILIVTGKGLPHPDEDPLAMRGILKERVPQWLNNSILRPLILSICYSQPKDGGHGALYVLLRRHRS